MGRVPRERSGAFLLAGEEEDDAELSRLEAALALDPRRPREAAASQPDLYYRAALRAARLEAQVAAAECDVLGAQERVAGPMREANASRHQPLSEEQIADRVRKSSEVDRAVRAAGELRRRLGMARALHAAYEARGRLLEALLGRPTV